MTLRPLVFALATVLALPLSAQAAKYTYHGDLMDGDAPAEGAYDLRVRAFAQPGASNALAEPTELPGVKLNKGRFSVELDLPEDADGTTWVEVAVRKAGTSNAFEKLGDPQPISKANSTCPGAWALDGNSGMPSGSFLGSADASALEFRVGNRRVMTIQANGIDAASIVGGSPDNVASSVNKGQTIAGGGEEGSTSCGTSGSVSCRNQTVGDYSTVGGGKGNRAVGEGSGVAGGISGNAAGNWSHVGGGRVNDALGDDSTIGGGVLNRTAGTNAVVAGGQQNAANDHFSTVSGGLSNRANGDFSVVVGGTNSFANGTASAVGGGGRHCAGGDYSWVGGFAAITRSGDELGDGSCGIASGDTDGDQGTFVWADYLVNGSGVAIPFTSTGANQFLVRASGGAAFNGTPANAGFELSLFGNDPDSGFVEVLLTPKPSLNGNTGESIEFGAGRGGASNNDASFRITQRNALGGFVQNFTIGSDGVTNVKNGAVGNVSDSRLKKNIGGIQQPLDTLLALRGHMFEYIDPAKSMNTPGMRMGFIAQEVQQTLPNWVTPNDNGYLQVSTIGFEALAVEAIRDLKTESDLRIEALESEKIDSDLRVKALQAELSAVLRRLDQIESRRER